MFCISGTRQYNSHTAHQLDVIMYFFVILSCYVRVLFVLIGTSLRSFSVKARNETNFSEFDILLHSL